MAPANLSTLIRKRLYTFARRLASPFPDSRRQRFVRDMVGGLVLANHVHLSKVARAIGTGGDDIHAAEKRLRRHLGSAHWDASGLADRLLAQSAALVGADTLITADPTDLAKYHARKLAGLGTIHDGSDPDQRLAPGYAVFEAYVRVGRWQRFPLRVEPLKTYAGAPTGENAEILEPVRAAPERRGARGHGCSTVASTAATCLGRWSRRAWRSWPGWWATGMCAPRTAARWRSRRWPTS
jgi:hypothetical protein